jgi:hydrogenase-1 operon protein HyaE
MSNATSAVLRRLLARPDVVELEGEEVDAFTATGTSLLFFTGNSRRYPEIDDVATVLPELMTAFAGRFRVGVVDPDVDRTAAQRFGVSIRPTLVFVRDGVVLGSIARMRDWAVYLAEIAAIVADPLATESLRAGSSAGLRGT